MVWTNLIEAFLTAELLNIIGNVFVASATGAFLVFIFMYIGEKNSLDEHIFPTVTRRQRTVFGFTGFYLLALSGLEILNPKSFETIGEGILFKPGFLKEEFVRDISYQDAVSLCILVILILWFLINTRNL